MAGGEAPLRRGLLLGSGEFEPWIEPVEREALAAAGGDGSVVVLATASAPEGEKIFQGWIEMGIGHYRGMGLHVRAPELRSRADAGSAAIAGMVRSASMTFFSGGNPEFLARTLEGTAVWDALLAALDGGAIFGGCSAGAVIAGAAHRFGPARGRFRFSGGLGLFPGDVFGVHWDSRFLARRKQAFRKSVGDGLRLVAIAEETAILNLGAGWAVHGRGAVEVALSSDRLEFRAGETFA
ncbi:MAG: Type 1 glutamine amidotransferase-like domain-containing protein [Candidatus Dormibacteria bacterium]